MKQQHCARVNMFLAGRLVSLGRYDGLMSRLCLMFMMIELHMPDIEAYPCFVMHVDLDTRCLSVQGRLLACEDGLLM